MIRVGSQEMVFDTSLRLGVEAYKSCWKNIFSCLREGDEYISCEDLNLLYSAAEVCESSLFYLIYNPQQFIQVAKMTSLTCFSVARFCQRYQNEEMENCAKSLDVYAQSCLTYVKPVET